MKSRKSQRGIVLIVALVALILLSFVAIRQFKSVDLSSRMGGNLAFRQASLQAADRGIEAAAQWLFSPAVQNQLSNDQPALGYYSSALAAEPAWVEDTHWGPGKSRVVPSASDFWWQKVEYQIHRLCRLPNTTPNGSAGGVANECVSGSPAATTPGSSRRVEGNSSQTSPKVQYRVTVRVTGARGAVSIVQAMLLGAG